MFEQLFKRRAAVISHRSAPFAAERQFYLKHLLDEGRSRKTLRNIAHLLFAVAHHLRLDEPEITLLAIEAAAEGWAKTTLRSARCRHVGERQFLYHAAGLLRVLGRLRESRPEVAYAERLEAFLHFQRQERCLSPSTLHHYEKCVGAGLAADGISPPTILYSSRFESILLGRSLLAAHFETDKASKPHDS
jgi:hypothetical protein